MLSSEELEAKRSAAEEAREAVSREEEEEAKAESRVEELTQRGVVLQAEADRLREALKAADDQVHLPHPPLPGFTLLFLPLLGTLPPPWVECLDAWRLCQA